LTAETIYQHCNMPFSNEDKALILYRFKNTVCKKCSGIFEEKQQKGRTGHVTDKDLETESTDQRHKTGRLMHAGTKENMTTVDELVSLLNQGIPETNTHII